MAPKKKTAEKAGAAAGSSAAAGKGSNESKSEQARPPKPVVKPAKVQVGIASDLALVPPVGPLKEALKVAVMAPPHLREVTIHRPIGCTRIPEPETAWVVTPTVHVADLLSRAENPYKRRDTERVQKARWVAIVQGLANTRISAQTGKAEFFRIAQQDAAGTEVLDRANAVEVAKAAYDKRDRPEGVKPDQDGYILELPEWVREDETSILGLLRDQEISRAVAAENPPTPYETRSGVLANVPQVEDTDLRGLAPGQVLDRLFQRLLSTPPPPPAQHAQWEEEGGAPPP